MTHRNARFDSSARISPEFTRREALQAAGALAVGALLWTPGARAAQNEAAEKTAAFSLPEDTLKAMSKSPLVYVSPLHKDGKESTCHGEVWFMHDDDSVLVLTGTERWKAEALRTGRDMARVWVGDFGPVKGAGDKYRAAPSFLAKATRELDQKVFDRLIANFAEKYPDGWGKWEPRFKKGWEDGSRTFIRYRAIGA